MKKILYSYQIFFLVLRLSDEKSSKTSSKGETYLSNLNKYSAINAQELDKFEVSPRCV